jgi:hydrogenase maturation protease
MRILVLGLGNDILADDAVGLLAARALLEELADLPGVVVEETSLHGMALLDIFLGHQKAILLDAIQTGSHTAGTILELDPTKLGRVISPSPHFAGLPEMMATAEQLSLDFPSEFRILAMEVADARTIGGAMTPEVEAAIPELARRAAALVREWMSRP